MNLDYNNISEKAVNILAKAYNPLDYPIKLAELLKNACPTHDFDQYGKYDLHRIMNNILVDHYNGEQVLKYKLFELYCSKRSIVAAFEIKVNNSRADFLTINGHTTCFEIKSELDNLSKLNKQLADYKLAFEYNNLIVDERHIEKAESLLPIGVGLWIYKNGAYKRLRKAQLNHYMCPEVQLNLLTKKELIENFVIGDGSVKRTLAKYSSECINVHFKKALKKRYKNRWSFLTVNRGSIFPVDLQFFFNTNILPDKIYYH